MQFEEFILQLRRKERDASRLRRKENMAAFARLLDSVRTPHRQKQGLQPCRRTLARACVLMGQ